MIRIGLSSCFMYDTGFERNLFKGKTLLYMEQSMSHYCMRNGALPLLLPEPHDKISVENVVSSIDGLLLQGGSDIAPTSYCEQGIEGSRWPGDPQRDDYEILLFKECLKQKKPVFGICRGLQLVNVALGGSLYQDTCTQFKEAEVHRDADIYDKLHHQITIENKSYLAQLYNDAHLARVNSIHHQSIKELGKGLVAEAYSEPDKIIEAIRYTGDSYVYGVQWHPEFHDPQDEKQMNPDVLFQDFLRAIKDKESK